LACIFRTVAIYVAIQPQREADMPREKIGRRTLTSLQSVTKPSTIYDTEVTGFGLKQMPSGVLSWTVEYRPGAGGRGVAKKRIVIGTPKTMTPEQARKAAADLLARVRLGEDPAASRSAERKSITVGDLLGAYMDDRIAKRKPGTAALYASYIRRHLGPALGKHRATAVTRADVAKLHRAVGTTYPVTANRLLTVLSAAWAYGAGAGLLPETARSPARGVEQYREQKRERYLSEAELARLGEAIRLAETDGIEWQSKKGPLQVGRTVIGPHAAAALRLLIFTGARLREMLHLKWSQVDLERGLLFLSDSKTGAKSIVIGAPSMAVLVGLPRVGQFVIAGDSMDKPRSDLTRPWTLVRRQAGLDGVRLHDLRHSFASVGAGAGMGLPILGKLLGHSSPTTTARYAHLSVDPLRVASDAIGNRLAAAMGEKRS
jgi:integrase